MFRLLWFTRRSVQRGGDLFDEVLGALSLIFKVLSELGTIRGCANHLVHVVEALYHGTQVVDARLDLRQSRATPATIQPPFSLSGPPFLPHATRLIPTKTALGVSTKSTVAHQQG